MGDEKKKRNGSIGSILKHADGLDMWLMGLGFLGAVADGTAPPLTIYLTGRLFNNVGAAAVSTSASASATATLIHTLRQVALYVLLTACGGWLACFIEGYCWTRTSERQASRMRSRYLKAVLRQDVGYFDLNATSTAEIVTSVSNDTLLIQEVITEKVPHFIATSVTFIGTCITAFLILWRLALVVFPFVLLLLIPSLVYGKILMNLARNIRLEYNMASTVAEQAISSIRTVYAFVGENKTIAHFSAALQGSVKLGLSQGLAKGLVIGSNGITYAIWAFITYYGSRMVMHHGALGGSVFVVGTCIAVGGQGLGAGLSNLKPIFEACSAAERINEVIQRVPLIDLDNMEGQILDKVLGQVEFKHVEFAYPSRSESIIFNNFSLKIPAGKTVALVRSMVGDRMSLLVQTISGVTIACAMGLFIAWRLALVMIAVQPLIIFSMYTRKAVMKSMSRKAIKAQQESSKLAAEAVSNHRTITAFSSQDRILKMLEKTHEGPRKENLRQSWFAGLALGTAQFLTNCIMAFDFWYGGQLISQGYISSKALIQTFLILVGTGNAIAEAASMTSDWAKTADVVGSLFAILDRYTRIEPDDSNGYIAEQITGHVELCGVNFAYPARPDIIILKDFSIKIEAGKSTALVGQSGSGKSTIISLIERFYDPLKGVVKISGRDIRSYHLRSLRKHIALVSQEPTLFAGTIRENIAYGASDKVDESEIIEAAKAANAHDFIAGLADGYDTFCGDRGVQLSGGQKQRIAIARAIIKNPTILLLDEATSALDSKSEKVVQEALDRVMVGRTSIVVAHRLSTIQNCHMIAVLEKGKVVEKGNHSSLLAKGPTGAYYSLVNLQRGAQDSTVSIN
ncbi:hypothetical protein CCACVL1_04806 [Corchorus capsularis]|uniref:ABC transporter, integral membrane type 1 n=1 Tax=Corchorus capsularis TaxID=210143 RepID=A0A1R3JPU2_COCAP|nr:hypothetical protein CCACVL1_04806 [Corchorus capsularis]